MRYARHDYYALEDAVSFGIQRSLTLDDNERWEVYVKLSNGNRVTYATNGTKRQARRALGKMIENILPHGSMVLLGSVEDTYVDARKVVRLFLDAQPEGFVAMAEDVTGEAYPLRVGTKRECVAAVREAIGIVSVLRSGDETPGEEDDAPPDVATTTQPR